MYLFARRACIENALHFEFRSESPRKLQISIMPTDYLSNLPMKPAAFKNQLATTKNTVGIMAAIIANIPISLPVTVADDGGFQPNHRN